MRSFSLCALFVVATTKLALAAAPDPIALAIVKQHFINSKLMPNPSGLSSFNPSALLTVDFKFSAGVISVGQPLAKDDTTFQPHITIRSGWNRPGTEYTFMMVDFNSSGSSNPGGYYLHWLSNNNTIARDGTLTPPPYTAVPYGGPEPPAGNGPHRYALLLFPQPSNFIAPSTLLPHTRTQLFSFTQYIEASGLGSPIAGSYFSVEVGIATFSVVPTTSVNTKTFTITPTTSNARSGPATKPTT